MDWNGREEIFTEGQLPIHELLDMTESHFRYVEISDLLIWEPFIWKKIDGDLNNRLDGRGGSVAYYDGLRALDEYLTAELDFPPSPNFIGQFRLTGIAEEGS